MATIKSYTDINQSKKLAEIIPIETADMKWYFWKEEIDVPKVPTFGYSKTAAESYKDTEAVYLPCWSLAALLSVLSEYTLKSNKFYGKVALWCQGISVECNNTVDACVAMIEKLNELNLL